MKAILTTATVLATSLVVLMAANQTRRAGHGSTVAKQPGAADLSAPRAVNPVGGRAVADSAVSVPKTTAKKNSVAANGAGDGKELVPVGDGKETRDFKGDRKSDKKLEGVEQGPPREDTGYTPGRIGFPPSVLRNPMSN